MGDKVYTRTATIYYKGELWKIRRMEEAVAAIRNRLNISFSAALQIFADRGMEDYIEDPDCFDPKLKELDTIVRFLDQARVEVAKKQELAQVYRDLGAERFFEIAEESGLDKSNLLEEVIPFLPGPSRSESMQHWISNTLSDGNEHIVDDVIKAAITEGILPDVEKDTPEFEKALSSFRKVASNLGASSRKRRGKWQLEEYIN